MKATAVGEPVREPITLAEARLAIGITSTADDSFIAGLVRRARLDIERITGRLLVMRSVVLRLDAGEAGAPICLPHAPIVAIDSFKEYALDGTATTVPAANYHLTDEGLLYVAEETVGWGTTAVRSRDAYRLAYRAGYAATTTASGAGSSVTTLNTATSVFQAGRDEGKRVYTFVPDAPLVLLGTIDTVTDSDTVELAGNASWSDGVRLQVGDIPWDLLHEVERRVVRSYEHRGEAVFGTTLSTPKEEDRLTAYSLNL